MHTCPVCGQACYCNGDIDDICVLDHDSLPDCDHCPELDPADFYDGDEYDDDPS
jgi:hypothetical protein